MNHIIHNSRKTIKNGKHQPSTDNYEYISENRGKSQTKPLYHKRQSRLRADIAFLNTAFASADARLPINEERKNNTLETLHRKIADKKILFVNDKHMIWWNQLRYTDRTTIFLHIFTCIFMLLILKLLDLYHAEYELMRTISMILSGILGSLSILAMGKSCLARLSELSESCFFNVRQMTAFDMVFSGIVSLTFLAINILLASFQWKISLLQIGLYVLVPFVFTQCACLAVLLTEKGRKSVWLVVVTGVFFSVSAAILTSIPQLYTTSSLLFWGMALIAGGTILGIQTRIFFAEINKGEILCTNWN